MKRIAVVVFIIVAVVVVAIGALAVFPPKELVKGLLVQQVKEATGRELAVKGAMSLRLLPSVVLRVEEVELKNASGPPRDPLFAAQSVLVEAQLWSMLFGPRVIDQVTLDRPRIALATDAAGQANWSVAQGGGRPIAVRAVTITGGTLSYRDQGSGELLQMAAVDGSVKDLAGAKVGQLTLKASDATIRGADAGPAVMLKAVDVDAKAIASDSVGEVALKAVKLLYLQSAGAAVVELQEPQASAKALSRSGALDAVVALVWNGEKVTGSVRMPSLAGLAEGKSATVSAQVATPKGTFDLDGAIVVSGGAAKVEGKTKAAAASLRTLATWAGVTLPATGAFGAAKVEGNVKLEGSRIVLDNALIVLDATKATGSLVVDFGQARPLLSGKLTADAIDVDSYFEPPQAPAPAKKPRTRELSAAAPAAAPAGTEKEALKDVLRAQITVLDSPPDASQPEASAATEATRALRVASAWPDDPVDIGALKTIDADIALSVSKLTVGGFDMGVPDLKAALKDGALSLDAKNLAVEGAQITGTARIDAREAQPSIAAKFKALGVDPKVVFEAFGQEPRIAGKATVDVDLSGKGNSARKLVETLNGRVKAVTNRGAIVGYDLNTLWGGFVAWLGQYDANLRTPFDELEAELALTNGVTSKSSVEITGPVLGVNGNGVVRLPSREIDYRARVNLVSWGQSAAVHILGGWLQPKVNVTNWGTLASTRALPTGNALEPLKDADLKDPELARLAGEVLKKGASKGALSPQVTEALEQLKARAEGKQ